jgi:tRNA (uracil-5-)-methyltransferase TRM9
MDVKSVYELIADHFDQTRRSHWECVRVFLDGVNRYSIVGDVGMGNGKYLTYRKDLVMIGVDVCEKLVSLATKKVKTLTDIMVASAFDLPYRDNLLDAAICIAVLHHMRTENERDELIRSVFKKLREGGTAFFTVWSCEQELKPKWIHIGNNDYMVPWTDTTGSVLHRYYHFFGYDDIKSVFSKHADVVKILDISYEMGNWCVTCEKQIT